MPGHHKRRATTSGGLGAPPTGSLFPPPRGVGDAGRCRGRDEIDVVAAVDLSVAATQEAAVESYLASRAGRYALMRQPAEKALAENWVGTPDAILGKIDAAVAQGITHFHLSNIAADSFASTIQQMEMFAEQVMPQVRGSPAPQTSVSST